MYTLSVSLIYLPHGCRADYEEGGCENGRAEIQSRFILLFATAALFDRSRANCSLGNGREGP